MWEKFKKNCIAGRRTGLGITALGDAIAALNIKYGTEESILKTEEIYRALSLGAWRSSVQMAKERGAFPIFELNREIAHPFVEQILDQDEKLKKDFWEFGRRKMWKIWTLTKQKCNSI